MSAVLEKSTDCFCGSISKQEHTPQKNLEEKSLSTKELAELVKNIIDQNPLSNPFPLKFNEQALIANEATNDWRAKFKLIAKEAILEKFLKAKFMNLTAGAYPNCSLERLIPIAQWIVFLYLNDDDVENRDSKSILSLNEKNMKILKNESQLAKDDEPITCALNDLMRRIEKIVNQNWIKRFLVSAEQHFQSTVWEATNREAGIEIPNYDEYIEQRMYTSAVYTVLPLIELAEQINIPEDIMEEYLLEFNLCANRIISWSNDIKSCPKEFDQKFKNNLIFVIKRHFNCSLDEAIKRSIDTHNKDVEHFEKLKEKLYAKLEIDSRLKPHSEHIRKYVEGIRYWLGSHYDFAFKSDRYN